MTTRPPREDGFALVEMLVALLLLSLVGLTLARFQTFQLGGAAELSLRAAAALEADNLAIELLLAERAPAAAIAGRSDNAGRRWHWTATPAPPPAPDLLPQTVAIDLAVAAAAGAPPLATRRILRPLETPRA